MRVVWVSDHLVVCAISDNPLVLAILYLEFVNELRFKVVRILADEELGSFAEAAHLLCVIRATLML